MLVAARQPTIIRWELIDVDHTVGGNPPGPSAVAMVEALAPEDDGSAEAAMRENLALRYNAVPPFLSLLGESNALGAAHQGGKHVLNAVRRLPVPSRRRVKEHPLLPRGSTRSWCRRCGVRCSPRTPTTGRRVPRARAS